jgi:hypothetical protein
MTDRSLKQALKQASLVRGYLLDSFLIFLLTAILILPLFRIEYLDQWGSIESIFIADARFLAENWPAPLWQPNWYCGTRFDYIYPPALRYGTAGLGLLLGVSTARAYHLYTAFFYCLGIAGVYLLARAGSGSRFWAWVAALATTLTSPIFLFNTQFRTDYANMRFMPVRLGAMIFYGEGPHMTALALIPFALAAAWFALRRGSPWALGLTGLLLAMIVSNNFYGASAMVIFLPILVWSLWLADRDWRIVTRAAAAAALAYGLIAAWFTPTYIQLTLRNMKLVSRPPTPWSYWVALGAAAVFIAITWKWARGKPEKAWSVFIAGNIVAWTMHVLGHHFFEFRLMGEPERHIPEFDMVFILTACWLLQWAMTRHRPGRMAAIAVLAATVWFVYPFPVRAWRYFREDRNPEQRIEYRLAKWMSENMPQARALAVGSVRFWYNAWHNLPMLGGGSEQGLMNLNTTIAYAHIASGYDMKLSIAWAQSLGVDAFIVHDQTSQEIYHDYEKPGEFKGMLKALYDDGEGNWVYETPRRWRDRARVVEAARMDAYRQGERHTVESVSAYASIVEQGPDLPVQLSRPAINRMTIRGETGPGHLLLVQETWDPSWKAYAGDRELMVRKDPMDFILIDPGPGRHEIRLQLEAPREVFIGRIVTAIALCVLLALLLGPWIFRRRLDG